MSEKQNEPFQLSFDASLKIDFQGAPAFAKPEIHEALKQRGVKYAIRLPANESLERDISELLTEPVGRPSHKPLVWCKSLLYQAASWKTARLKNSGIGRGDLMYTGGVRKAKTEIPVQYNTEGCPRQAGNHE